MKRALFIGINYKNTDHELAGCENDIINMHKFLSAKYPQMESRFICDKDRPTKSRILKSLKWLTTNLADGDSVFFHYSGHGTYLADENNDESDGHDEAIVACDDIITDDELFDYLKRLKDTITLYVVMDCCHSGSNLDLKYNLVGNDLLIDSNKEMNAKVILFSACRDNEYATDDGGDLPAGAFTRDLLKHLQKKITYRNLLRLLRHDLKKYHQIPQISTSKKININDVVSLSS